MTAHLLLTLWALDANLEKRSAKERGVGDGRCIRNDRGSEVAKEDVEGIAERVV